MRLLYILERWPELSQTFVAQEIAALESLGCQVEVACVSSGDGPPSTIRSTSFADLSLTTRLSAASAQIIRAPGSAIRQITSERAWPPPGGRQKTRGLLRLAPFRTAAARADHIHAHFATEAADIARLLSESTSTPWSFTAHGADAYGDADKLRRNLTSAQFARAASPHVADRLTAACPEAVVVEIPVAVAVENFARRGPYNESGPLVSTGRLIEKKGFDDLINAFDTARLGDRELWIIGDGPLRHDLEGQAEHLNVRFLGALGPTAVAQALWEASAFVLLSKVAANGDRDGRPAAIVEAMAAGIPVISTSVPGISDLVHPDCGLLVEPASAVQAAVAIRELMDLPAGAREAMGSAGVARSAAFSPPAVAEQLLALFSA